jgi:methyl-accepting chemotaxis protein
MNDKTMIPQSDLTNSAGYTVSARKRVALTALCLKLLPIWGRQLAISRLQSEEAVGEMLKSFASIRPHLETAVRQSSDVISEIPYDAKLVSEKVEQMYVGFQYQDRVNQMMALLQEDMAHLQTILESPETDQDAMAVDAWLSRLESKYAMHEQRRAHDKGVIETESQPKDGTSFF